MPDSLPTNKFIEAFYQKRRPSYQKILFIPGFQDVVYSNGLSVFYIISRYVPSHGMEYIIYKYNDETMTSFGTPPIQHVRPAWKLCIRKQDILTFASANRANGSIFAYFQRPDVMLEIFSSGQGWRKVHREVYSDCIDQSKSVRERKGA